MLSAARCASCTCQKITASTLTGTVSRGSACSALNCVVWMRSSITAVILSMMGMMANRPGPFTLDSLPARRMTKRSQLLAILSAKKVSTASRKKTAPACGICAMTSTAPMAPKTTVTRRVMGFMGELPHRRKGGKTPPPLQILTLAAGTRWLRSITGAHPAQYHQAPFQLAFELIVGAAEGLVAHNVEIALLLA